MTSHRLARLGSLVAAALAVGGCSGPEPYSVSGQVLVGGKAAAGVYVVLSPAGGDAAAASNSARTDREGNYSLRTPAAGEYAVTAFWPEETFDEGSVVEGPDRFGGRYRDPQHPVTVFKVHAGENAFEPIQLRPSGRR